MKLTIKTSKLQDLVTRASKGSSNNKMLPLTGFMCVEMRDNKLTLITTDGTNYLYVSEDKLEGANFYVVVQSETFTKLISKQTCENITLSVEDDALTIAGNGKYKMDLPLDEEGRTIVFPNPLESLIIDTVPEVVHLSTIKSILLTAKSALATTLDIPCYTGYYVGKDIIATDTMKICGIDIKLFADPVLISSETMDLLDVMQDEQIHYHRIDNTLIFQDTNNVLIAKTLEGIDDYAVGPIGDLLDSEFASVCAVSKSAILQTLDRLSLFVGPYDKNGVYLTFTNDGLIIDSKKSNGSEKIDYAESENFKDFTCCIDIEMLRSQIKSTATEKITIHYGLDNCIKMTEGNVTQIVALLEDDRVEE